MDGMDIEGRVAEDQGELTQVPVNLIQVSPAHCCHPRA
jgi:hypothetical protein